MPEPANDVTKRFVNGDETAVRELYRRHGRALFGAAYRILRNTALAEEAVQIAFTKAWRAADTFDVERSITPWLVTIVKRTAIDIYRREKRHFSDDIADHEVGVTGVTFEGTWSAFEVRSAIEQLPGEERDVLMATHFTGLSHQQAADHLGLPIGTIKSRNFRAYRRLRTMLSHLGEVTP